jgi:hypothetical protein
MSEQDKPKNYMQQLDEWTDECVIAPLTHALLNGPDEAVDRTKAIVRKAIREKALESYHNGQAATPAKPYKRTGYAKR